MGTDTSYFVSNKTSTSKNISETKMWVGDYSNVTDRLGHDARYAIDFTKLQKNWAGNLPCSLRRI